MHSCINGPNKGRLKRSSFSRESKLIEQGNQSMLGIKNITPLETHAPTPPWEEEPNINIHSHITNIESKSKYSDLELKELTCTYLDKNFPREEWIRVYTHTGQLRKQLQMEVAGLILKCKIRKR